MTNERAPNLEIGRMGISNVVENEETLEKNVENSFFAIRQEMEKLEEVPQEVTQGTETD